MVRHRPNSFGYVELIYAQQNKMSFGTVKNSSGKFVKASTDGVTAAAAATAKAMPPTIASPSRTPRVRTRIRSRALPGY